MEPAGARRAVVRQGAARFQPPITERAKLISSRRFAGRFVVRDYTALFAQKIRPRELFWHFAATTGQLEHDGDRVERHG